MLLPKESSSFVSSTQTVFNTLKKITLVQTCQTQKDQKKKIWNFARDIQAEEV